jgi:uncharacterized protein (TIGR00296 family)
MIARQAIELWVRRRQKLRPGKYPKDFDRKSGVFVTIHTYPGRELRGCIGFPEPSLRLIDALVEAAIASTHDPRFPPLKGDELDRIIVEASVLTKPESINVDDPRNYPKKIRIGRDGLIVRKGSRSGLLLPQVATDHGLDEKGFLMHVCLKAGLPPDAWLGKDVRIFRFRSLVFSEKEPGKTALISKEITDMR